MSKSYDVPRATATWVDSTDQTEYTLTWEPGSAWLSGVNLNDGTEWSSPAPVEDPERFGPLAMKAEFFSWVARFIGEES